MGVRRPVRGNRITSQHPPSDGEGDSPIPMGGLVVGLRKRKKGHRGGHFVTTHGHSPVNFATVHHMAIVGENAELIDKLLLAVNSSDWEEFSWILVFAVGGEPAGLTAETGRNYPPGSVGAKVKATHRVVDRGEYFACIRSRLLDLVRSGLREDVLVRALRDDIGRLLRTFVGGTEEAQQGRAKMKADLERRAADPQFIARWRAKLAEEDPANVGKER